MKLVRPDLKATSKWKSKSTKVEIEIKENVSIGVINNIMANAHTESMFEQNRYIVSAYMTKFVTKVEDENGNPVVELPRDEIESNGVCLIDSEFIETIPPVLFMEIADECMSRALQKITEKQAKN